MRMMGVGFLGSDCYDLESGESITCPGSSGTFITDGPTFNSTSPSTGGTTPVTGGSNSSSAWATAISNIFSPITKAIAVNQLPAGAVLISGPNGTQVIRYASGQQVPYVPGGIGVGTATGSGSMLLIGAVVLGVIMMAGKR